MNENTVEQAAVKRLERSRSDRMLAGVCGGLARYFDIHPAFYRVGFVVLTLIGGAGILIYAAAALVMPDEGEEDSVASAALRDRKDRPWPLIGLALVAVAGLVLLSRVSIWPHGDAAWILLLIAGAIILQIAHRPRSLRTDGEHDGPVSETGGEQAAPVTESSRPLRRTRRVAWAIGTVFGVILAFVLVAAAIFAAVFRVHVDDGIGDQTYHVADVRDLRSSYKLGIGDLRVNLSELKVPRGETRVSGRVDVGRLLVIVPSDVSLRVRADADFGTVDLLGSSSDGRKVDKSFDETGRRVLVLDAHVGAGSVHVDRAVR
jgi:phage shock protein PspC (stress-responsive transcriptional regulator)